MTYHADFGILGDVAVGELENLARCPSSIKPLPSSE